jgi:peptidoglycan/LPS O-acetylase OafA/YrhL
MKRPWFRPWGWIYRPVAPLGWLVLALTLMFCANVFIAVDRHSHSASDTLYGIFPFVVPAFGIAGWIASRTSQP